jgi:hypothetical protein
LQTDPAKVPSHRDPEFLFEKVFEPRPAEAHAAREMLTVDGAGEALLDCVANEENARITRAA